MSSSTATNVELRRYLGGLRIQLWWREGAVSLSRGVAAGAVVALVLTGAAVWSARPPGEYSPALAAATVAMASLALAFQRRPTLLRAARQADRQRSLLNRLATAAEILDGQITSDLDALQLADAGRVSEALPVWRAFPRSTKRARNAALLGATAAASALIVAAEIGTQGQSTSQYAQAPPLAAEVPRMDATQVTTVSPQQLQQARARSATEQAALSQLADQLRDTGAARDIGQALKRGDVAGASTLLSQLAQNSDQLSQTAKQELAGALLNASNGTADPQLKAAELAAIRAMTRSDYQAARTALESLAAAVATSQNGTLTQQQLVQQIQQLEHEAALAGNGADCGTLTNDGEFLQDCSAAGQSTSSGAMGVVSRGSGQSPSAGVGEVAGGHGFATSGVDISPMGQTPTHVDLPAADVPVDLALSSANGSGTPADQHALTLAVSQSNQQNVQQMGGIPSAKPGIQEAERTLIAPSRRAAVREFFGSQASDGNPP